MSLATTRSGEMRPQRGLVRGPGRFVLPRSAAFWVASATLALLLFAASAPSPLYSVYQARWHFSAATLTAVFAVYAVLLLGTLLVFGSVSDHLGRRPVIVIALVVDVAATVMFLLARGVAALYAARALQGIATGAATSALSAALIEFQPQRPSALGPLVNSAAPAIGLATGALASSVLVQYAPAPMRLVYWLLLVTLVIGALAACVMPEPGRRRPGVMASLRPRVSMPRSTRATFAAALPCLVALWALAGLYLSVGPSLALGLLHSHNHLWGGVLIFVLMGASAVTSVVFRTVQARAAMLGGCATVLVGVGITLPAIATGTFVPFVIGTAIAGAGFGPAFTGAFRAVSARAPASERAEVIAAIYVLAYLAFSIPVVLAGVLVTHIGLRDTALAYAGAIMALVAIALLTFAAHRGRRPDGEQRLEAGLHWPPCPGTVPHGAVAGQLRTRGVATRAP